jgi:stress-induced morphogen
MKLKRKPGLQVRDAVGRHSCSECDQANRNGPIRGLDHSNMFSLTRRLLPTVHSARAFSATACSRNAPASSQPELLEGEQLITQKLVEKFAPSQLQVQDVSGMPHRSAPIKSPSNIEYITGGCGSFYSITIASETFKGLPIVKQHKLVTETLKKEIAGIHGLQVGLQKMLFLKLYYSRLHSF